ncbi:hypothetical protein, partial [Pantoea ananatis]|uniref:hypothetical protein n=1 Tax=Pantoea ananas TaxID=553 RepID=UPI000796B7F6
DDPVSQHPLFGLVIITGTGVWCRAGTEAAGAGGTEPECSQFFNGNYFFGSEVHLDVRNVF